MTKRSVRWRSSLTPTLASQGWIVRCRRRRERARNGRSAPSRRWLLVGDAAVFRAVWLAGLIRPLAEPERRRSWLADGPAARELAEHDGSVDAGQDARRPWLCRFRRNAAQGHEIGEARAAWTWGGAWLAGPATTDR